MGCDAHVIVVGERAPEQLVRARVRLDELERRWSRFLADSEVNRLNREAGSWCVASSDTALLVRRALDGYAATEGRYDPTVLGDMLRAGYSRTLEDLHGRGEVVASGLRIGADRIEVDPPTGLVRLPAGVGFDPGGIGKGLAADLVVAELIDDGAQGVCVNLGGDLRVAGMAPSGGAWRIAIEDPSGGDSVDVVRLTDGGVTTSSRVRRTWSGSGGQRMHHVMDPGSGTSASTPLRTASVIASEGWRAEVFSKLALIDGSIDGQGRPLGVERIEAVGAAALLVDDARVAATQGWDRFSEPRREAA